MSPTSLRHFWAGKDQIEKERGFLETGKVKDEMKMKVKRGLYRGGGRLEDMNN